MKCEKLFERIAELEAEYIDFWADICRIESPTEDKEAVDRVGAYVIEKAKAKGWKIDVQEQPISGNCVCITMNPDSKGKPVCLSAHMDTVHPVGLFGPDPVKIEDGKIYGPGVVDCKGGIASGFLAMAALQDIGFTERPVKLLCQSDEENSSRFSQKGTVDYMCKMSEGCAAFLNCEGYEPGFATIARKGILRYGFEITGKAAHASACFDGHSAICEAAYKIVELEKMKDRDGGLTCNCGLINGGSAENAVPASCTFTADIRFPDEAAMNEAKRIVEKVANTSYVGGTTCTVTLKSSRIAMEYNERNKQLLDTLNAIYEENGLPVLKEKSGLGGSDAAEVTAYGLPCLDCLGTAGGGIHSRAEYGYLDSLTLSAKLLAAAAYCL